MLQTIAKEGSAWERQKVTLYPQAGQPLVGQVCTDAGLNVADNDRSSVSRRAAPNANRDSTSTLEQRLQCLL